MESFIILAPTVLFLFRVEGHFFDLLGDFRGEGSVLTCIQKEVHVDGSKSYFRFRRALLSETYNLKECLCLVKLDDGSVVDVEFRDLFFSKPEKSN